MNAGSGRGLKRLLAVAIAASLSLGLAFGADDPRPKPNVIVVLTDDQGYGDLSGHGNPVLSTPNLDELRNGSVHFRDFHVDAYCTPTRSALMTGRYSHRAGGWSTVRGRNMLRDGELTMADVFRHNGYRTGHFGKWHLGAHYPYRPIDRGFDESLTKGDGGTGCTTDFWGNDRVHDTYSHNGKREERRGYETDVLFDEAMAFIRARKDAPCFVYLAPYAPHGPCSLPDEEWARAYRGRVPPATADFFASIARVDWNLGRLRACLEKEGMSKDTILLFLTDNGTASGEQVFNAGMRGKKGSHYDGGHRVPCFLHWPAGGMDQPREVTQLAAHLDLLPTLVDLCGLSLPRPVAFDGRSLRPLLENPAAAWPDRALVMGCVFNDMDIPRPRWTQTAVMQDRWRLVDGKALYDLRADPGQKKDVAASHPEVVSRLRSAYEDYVADVTAETREWEQTLGRPILGATEEPEVALCAETWVTASLGQCPWNQGSVLGGKAAFGTWRARVAKAGAYRFEVRRWPREADASLAGVPSGKQAPDALLLGKPVLGCLYGGTPRPLPVARVRLRVHEAIRETEVRAADREAVFDLALAEGPVEIQAQMLDAAGQELAGAYYVYVRPAGGGAESMKRPLAADFAAALPLAPAPGAERAGPRPNLVLILADDLGWKDVGYAGSTFYRTPNIDRLAREGIRFDRAYAAGCVCSPSRGAIYSGKNPARTALTCVFPGPGEPEDALLRSGPEAAGCQNLAALQRRSLPRAERTVAEVLSQAGYATAFFGKWHCGEIPGYQPDERGWQTAKGYRQAKAGGSTRGHWGDSYSSPDCLANLPGLGPRDYLADVLTDEAVRFIRERKDGPFHLVLAHYLVHKPLQAKPGLDEPYRVAAKGDQRNPVYAAMIESLDRSVGRVLQALREEGVDENTLVVLTSDNGGLSGFGALDVTSNYPLLGGKSFPFEAGMRVPLAMRWPARIKGGTVCAGRVVGMDLYPTFLEAAGLPPLPGQHRDGASLLPAMTGTGQPPARPLVFHFPHYTHATGPNSVLIDENWKLIRFYNDADGRFLLFDLGADPGEQKDLSARFPDKARAMDERLSALLKDMAAHMPAPNPAYDPRQPAVGTRRTTQELALKKRAVEEQQVRAPGGAGGEGAARP